MSGQQAHDDGAASRAVNADGWPRWNGVIQGAPQRIWQKRKTSARNRAKTNETRYDGGEKLAAAAGSMRRRYTIRQEVI